MPFILEILTVIFHEFPSAFEHLFHAFNAFDKGYKTIYGYRPLAIDGSSVMIPYDPTNESTLRKSGKSNEYNAAHLSCLFDLKKRIYILMPKSSQSIKKMNIKLYNIWSISIMVLLILFLSWTGDMNAIIQLHTSSKRASVPVTVVFIQACAREIVDKEIIY